MMGPTSFKTAATVLALGLLIDFTPPMHQAEVQRMGPSYGGPGYGYSGPGYGYGGPTAGHGTGNMRGNDDFGTNLGDRGRARDHGSEPGAQSNFGNRPHGPGVYG